MVTALGGGFGKTAPSAYATSGENARSRIPTSPINDWTTWSTDHLGMCVAVVMPKRGDGRRRETYQVTMTPQQAEALARQLNQAVDRAHSNVKTVFPSIVE